jgi:conjugative transposon TraK protein
MRPFGKCACSRWWSSFVPVALAGFVVYKSYHLAENIQSHIYVLANGKAMRRLPPNAKKIYPWRQGIMCGPFTSGSFTLSPDDKAIQATITKALYLADASARSVYESLKENNYYTGIITGNVSQEVSVDSVLVNLESEPYSFRCWATVQITRPSAITIRSLLTEGIYEPSAGQITTPTDFSLKNGAFSPIRILKQKNGSHVLEKKSRGAR